MVRCGKNEGPSQTPRVLLKWPWGCFHLQRHIWGQQKWTRPSMRSDLDTRTTTSTCSKRSCPLLAHGVRAHCSRGCICLDQESLFQSHLKIICPQASSSFHQSCIWVHRVTFLRHLRVTLHTIRISTDYWGWKWCLGGCLKSMCKFSGGHAAKRLLTLHKGFSPFLSDLPFISIKEVCTLTFPGIFPVSLSLSLSPSPLPPSLCIQKPIFNHLSLGVRKIQAIHKCLLNFTAISSLPRSSCIQILPLVQMIS